MVLATIHSSKRLFSLLLLLGLAAGFVSAQIPGGMNETVNTNLGGNNFIVGTVFWPSGRPVNTRMRIKLVSLAIGEILSSTDDSGKFVFSRIGAGSYSVVIDGDKDYESVTQNVEVDRNRNPMPQTYTLSIRLTDSTKSLPRPGVINSETARVPKPALELYKRAVKLAGAKDHKAAIEQLRLAVVEYPQFVDAYNEMGVQYMRLNELEKADEALQAALKIKPRAFEPLLNHGITLFRLKRFAEAEQLLRAAIGVKGKSAVAHYYLGRCLTSLERYEEAEKELNSAITVGDGQMNEGHRMLASLFIAKGEDKRAIKALETYLSLAPEAADAANLRQVIRQLKSPRPTQPKTKQ